LYTLLYDTKFIMSMIRIIAYLLINNNKLVPTKCILEYYKYLIHHVVVDGKIIRCIMDVSSMRSRSGISDNFIVKKKVRFRLSIKWKES